MDKNFLRNLRREGRERRMAMMPSDCKKCGGRGYLVCSNCFSGVISTNPGVPNYAAYRMGVWAECPRCLGDGWVKCDQCF